MGSRAASRFGLILLAGLLALPFLASCADDKGLTLPAPKLFGGAAAGKEVAPRLTMGDAVALPHRAVLHQRHPAIAYGDGVYLLVWQEGFNGQGGKSQILGMRISDKGVALDKEPISIARSADVSDSPAVAYCAGKFLVAWSEFKSGNYYGIVATSVDREGRAPGFNCMFLSNQNQARPAVASNGKDQFLVVWQGFHKGEPPAGAAPSKEGDEYFGIFGARVSATDGTFLDKGARLAISDHGERPVVTWTGSNYAVCQKWYGTLVGEDGKVQVSTTLLWNGKTPNWSAVAAAWGKAFLFFNTEPWPDPWGWGGNGAIVGVSLAADGKSPERDWEKAIGKELHNLKADARVRNCLDVAQWRNHPSWPMGMRGSLKGTVGDIWPNGVPAAAFNGRSLVVVWPRAHLVDTRRLANRDLYLTRVLPDWGMVDRPPVKLVAGPTEEANPVLCAGPLGQTLLAYERIKPAGVGIEYRLLTEAEDRTAPQVVRVMPKSENEVIVAFDKPIEASSVEPKDFRIVGRTKSVPDHPPIKSAVLNSDPRGLGREVVLTVEPALVASNTYMLLTLGVKDRTPGHNASGEWVEFLAKPGQYVRGEFVPGWAILGPVQRDLTNHPFDPKTVRPSPGDKVGEAAWAAHNNPIIEFGDENAPGRRRPDSMLYANAYLFSDRERPVVLRLDSNTHNRGWLNGRQINDGITKATAGRGFHDYADELPVTLAKGWNQLLVQVENRFGTMALSAQFTDKTGQPLRDLTWQLAAPAK